jgi:hypothetical protein
MGDLGPLSVCFLEQLRPLLRAWAFATYYIKVLFAVISAMICTDSVVLAILPPC